MQILVKSTGFNPFLARNPIVINLIMMIVYQLSPATFVTAIGSASL